ncbi:MAG: hypothetical protein KF689_00085 [Gemmatimonadaceae bacterium]|nr:hypothetical protein [Gemmatimonadaceae bacterium]MCW5827606.1 hypothetical protein [Gemmatimonadaceae bacterium]
MTDYSAFNDISTAVSAAVVAILAAIGLGTWKTQLRGTAEYEMARRLLRATYKLRDELSYVRSPWMSAGEMHAAAEASGEKFDAFSTEQHNRAFELAMNRRWRRLGDARTEMEAELLEAEVLWGPVFKTHDEELKQILLHLSFAIEDLLRDRRSTTPRSGEERKKVTEITWSSRDSENRNAFSDRIDSVIREFEALLKPHLARVR